MPRSLSLMSCSTMMRAVGTVKVRRGYPRTRALPACPPACPCPCTPSLFASTQLPLLPSVAARRGSTGLHARLACSVSTHSSIRSQPSARVSCVGWVAEEAQARRGRGQEAARACCAAVPAGPRRARGCGAWGGGIRSTQATEGLPVASSTNQPINQPTNQSISQPINQPINPSPAGPPACGTPPRCSA